MGEGAVLATDKISVRCADTELVHMLLVHMLLVHMLLVHMLLVHMLLVHMLLVHMPVDAQALVKMYRNRESAWCGVAGGGLKEDYLAGMEGEERPDGKGASALT